MADRFPGAHVIGTDLSPVQPGMQPPNCQFEIDDCCSPWIYPPGHFDLVHIRGLFGSIADWPALYAQAYAHTRPGGHIEQLEWSVHNRSQAQDGALSPRQTLARWSRYAVDVGRRSGKTFEIAETMAALVKDAGFVDVVERRFKWPIGPWSSDPRMKEIGRWNLLSWEQGMEGWVLASYTRVLGVCLSVPSLAAALFPSSIPVTLFPARHADRASTSGPTNKSRSGSERSAPPFEIGSIMSIMNCMSPCQRSSIQWHS